MKILTHNSHATECVAELVAHSLKPGQVLALHGDLGAGKTVFSRGLARGLGITEPVTSPTFTVVQEYNLPDGKYLYHLDMYRIANDNDAIAFGIDEFLFNPNAYTVVEWPEQIPGLLGKKAINISLEHASENQRIITLPDNMIDPTIHWSCGIALYAPIKNE